MKHVLALTVATTILTLGGGAAAFATVDDQPPANTIVDVSGDPDHGWTVEHYDGSVTYPPKVSEARARCNDINRAAGRARCRARMNTANYYLWQLKRSLDWAGSR